MNCEKCKEQDDCDIYQEWLNTRDSCCPFGDYQKSLKDKEMMKKIKMKYVGFLEQ